MRCLTCNEYIYKGRKFNSRLETVQGESYMGLRVYRMYIKCPRCLSEITFKTDMKNEDYELEHGATRNFDSIRLAERAEAQRIEAEKAELANNPMRVLEERTKQSQFEIEMHETLEDLRALRDRHAHVDTRSLLNNLDEERQKTLEERQKTLEELQDEEERRIIESAFGKKVRQVVHTERLSGPSTSRSEDNAPLARAAEFNVPEAPGPSGSASRIIFEKPGSSKSEADAKPASQKASKSTFSQSPFAVKRSVLISYDDEEEDGAPEWKPVEKKRFAADDSRVSVASVTTSSTVASVSTLPSSSHPTEGLPATSTAKSSSADSAERANDESASASQHNASETTDSQQTSDSVAPKPSAPLVSQPAKPSSSVPVSTSQKVLNSALAGLKKSVIVRKK